MDREIHRERYRETERETEREKDRPLERQPEGDRRAWEYMKDVGGYKMAPHEH